MQPQSNKRERSRLEVLMRDMTKEERLAVMSLVGYSPETWWRWAKRPRVIPTGALIVLVAHLEAKHAKAIPLGTLLEPHSLV